MSTSQPNNETRTVYSSVSQSEGVITDMRVFGTPEEAKDYFGQFIDAYGAVDDCEPEMYNDGKDGFFYWWNGRGDEITIWPVEMRR